MGHVAGVAVRHPQMVAAGRHYGCKVETCVPYDPESKGGSESTVKVAKRDLVPTEAHLLDAYATFAALVAACDAFCEKVKARVHRETGRTPADMLAEEAAHLHVLPAQAHTAALGETRVVGEDQTNRFGSVRYSTPDGHQGAEVWCRVVGEELVIVGRGAKGLVELVRHALSTPGHPQILDEHYPHHPGGNGPRPPKIRPKSEAEVAFCAIGEGATRWLVEAAAVSTARIPTKMAEAVELAALVGGERVEEALGMAAIAGRFGEGDLVSILDHIEAGRNGLELIRADEAHSVQPGTRSWEGFGRPRPHRPFPPSRLPCCGACACLTSAPLLARCWPPPGRSAGTRPRCCGCSWSRRSPAEMPPPSACGARWRASRPARPSTAGGRPTRPSPFPRSRHCGRWSGWAGPRTWP